MCGIAGYWSLTGGDLECFDSGLNGAVAALHHRGPDDRGVWSNNAGVGLGHSRLSILDLSEHGHQPMKSHDGRFIMVFNGEVYNFREIRKELVEKGHQFESDGDSEVVLASFQQWGKECVHHFIGMFAFAVWDIQEQKLLLCRDRVGVKPLYYGWNGRVFWFGSEVKALLSFKHWEPSINMQALGEFFQFGDISAPRSIFDNVSKLQPGHWLEIDRSLEGPVTSKYWSVLDVLSSLGAHKKSEEELVDELEELLISAFKYRMVSDVPVGVFLSGGIDSSIVAAILQKHSIQQIHTFTIGFEDKACDESGWARKVADHIGSKHTEYKLGLDKAKEIIPRLPQLYDEPFADSSGIPTFMVSSLAAKDVKVVLSADGGDELFGGYNSYKLVPQRLKQISRRPYWVRALVGKGLSMIPMPILAKGLNAISFGEANLPSRLLRKCIKLETLLPDVTPADVFRVTQTHWMPKEIDQLFGSHYINPRVDIDHFPGCFEEQMTLWDFHHYLPDDIMVKVDRATMGASIEGREPLLDHRLIEFAFRLPLKYRIGKLGQKHLLRKVLYKYVPRELIDRPKMGFGIPINQWMRANDASLASSLLQPDSSVCRLLNRNVVEQEVSLLKKSGVNETRVWQLLMLEKWMKEYGL